MIVRVDQGMMVKLPHASNEIRIGCRSTGQTALIDPMTEDAVLHGAVEHSRRALARDEIGNLRHKGHAVGIVRPCRIGGVVACSFYLGLLLLPCG